MAVLHLYIGNKLAEGRPKQPRTVRPTLIESQSPFDQLIHLFGNFVRLSHGFCLRLAMSIKVNPDYLV